MGAATRVATVGAGAVGRALAGRLAGAGLDVTLAMRDPARTPDGWTGRTSEVAAALDAADVVVVAVPGTAVPAFAAEHGARLAGRVVLDASNDMSGGGTGPLHHRSAWDEHAPGAHVFRAFNTLGWDTMARPVVAGERADLLYSGPDGPPDATARTVIAATGLRPVRVGGPEADGLLDGATRLWFALAMRDGRRRRLAFRVIEEPPG
jgi:8-hydroxy-5-deazaflavin:NADPH oxidoreductase